MSATPWTPEQERAILTREDALLVANAGTGKTTTVVGKILWLLGLDVGVERCPDPCGLHEIAAITFTEKAAYDLKRKLRQEIEASERGDELRWEVDRASVGTIHSFCGSLLREHALRLGVDPGFRVLDERETTVGRQAVVREVVLEALEEGVEGLSDLYRDLGFHGRERRKGLLELVGTVMGDLAWHERRWRGWTRDGDGALDRERLAALCGSWTEGLDDDAVISCDALAEVGRRALERWLSWLDDENARDFDRLILDAHALLTGPRGGPALSALRDRYRILVVDEFQDTDRAQQEIVFAVGRGRERPQLFLVGDPKQSIYRFRGADVSVWNDVEAEIRSDGRVLDLTRNFRSRPAVVDFVNEATGAAMDAAARELSPEDPGSVVEYAPLEPGREPAPSGGVEWLVSTEDKADDRRVEEAERVARRIRAMVDPPDGRPLTIRDDGTGEDRPCRFSDIAVLYRTRYGMERYEEVLLRHGIPLFRSDPPRLEARQEVLDLVNALRLVDNPLDDLRAFAWLRSPFVGLRDETLARIRMSAPRRSLFWTAARYLEDHPDGWWDPPEDRRIVAVEREALRRGVGALKEARELAARLPLDELARRLLEATGYRLHLHVGGRAREAEANLRAFLLVLEEYRDRPLGAFLEIWDRWDRTDTGVPSAAIHSREDDVVTFTTFHRAKGLEWPVVFLVDLDAREKWRSGSWISDPALGPLLLPSRDDAGERARRIENRNRLEERAEEARVLYVAATRARERLVVVAPEEPAGDTSHAAWLVAPARREEGTDGSDGSGPRVDVRRETPDLPPPEPPDPVPLSWLDRIAEGEAPAIARRLPRPPLRFATSATELMTRAEDPEAWERRYLHGVQASWEFARAPRSGGRLPADVRGTVIHGVLERLEEERELGRVLDEAIGELESPEVEALLSPGTRYRRALEAEIRRVVSSPQWAWYVDGPHRRELPFVHLVGPREWRLGAFDLYRSPGGSAPTPSPAPPPADANLDLFRDGPAGGDEAWIVDFKTHEIGAERAADVARRYEIQARVYREAAAVRRPARVRFHFTHPNMVVDTSPEGPA